MTRLRSEYVRLLCGLIFRLIASLRLSSPVCHSRHSLAVGALLLALAPIGASGQVSILGAPVTATETSGTQFSKTMSFTVPAGNDRLLVVTSGGDANLATLNSVTFGVTALTKAIGSTSGTVSASIWYLALGSSATATTANIVVTYSNTYIFVVTALTLQGVNQTTPVSGAVSANTQNLTVTSAAGDFVIDAIVGFGSSVAAASGQTVRALNNNIVFGLDPDSGTSTSPGAASVAMNWSGFTSGIAHAGVNIRQVGVATPVTISPTTLPNTVVNAAGYSQTLTASGGTGTKNFSIVNGSLPPGLTFSSGTLSGTPTTAGTYTFTVSALDTAGNFVLQPYTIIVSGTGTPLAITTTSLPNAVVGVGYNQAVVATGGSGVYTYLVSGGTLPPGLTNSAGTISGTPTSTAPGTHSFTVVVTDSLGVIASRAFTIIVSLTAPVAQTITFGPLPNKVVGDAPFTLTATASSGQPVSFAVSGPATISGTTLTLTGTPGLVTVTASRPASASFAAAADVVQTFTVAAAANANRLINLSSRVRIAPDPSRSLIAGFVIGGTQSKRVVVRAIGPTLGVFGVTGALVNPRLQIFDSAGTVVLENDDWSGADTAAAFGQVSAFALPAGSRDAALLATLAPGAYTMQITAGTETGIALAEVYDASANPGAETQRLVNISTRGMVEAGDGVLIGGFVIKGDTAKKVLIRGIGPRLAVFGVAGALADPRLAIYSGQTVVAQNDNWSVPTPVNAAQTPATAAELTAVAQSVGAFALGAGSLDAAVLVTLPPGAYTAQVAGAGTTTGVALVEIYEVP